MSDEVQLELMAPWYTQNTSESRTLELFDAIPKYPFAVTTNIPKPERLEVPFTLRGQRYTAFIAPARSPVRQSVLRMGMQLGDHLKKLTGTGDIEDEGE